MTNHNHHHYPPHGPRLRFCLQATVNVLLAFGLAQVLAVPQHGLWTVLAAVVGIQMSIGGSLKAAAENIVGTIAGGAYATMVAALVPHSTLFAFAAVLAVAVAPLAYAAAVSPSFRAAPVTAVLVLMISAQLGGTAQSRPAFFRSLGVAIGGGVAIAVSLLVFPARAHALGLHEAVRVLQHMAQVLQPVMVGFRAPRDPLEAVHLQDDIGEAVHAFAEIAGEAKPERLVHLAYEPDPAALSRTLLRLRHDLVMLGRAASAPLPDHLAARLGPVLTEIAERATDHLLASAGALGARHAPPPAENVERALAAYLSELASCAPKVCWTALPKASGSASPVSDSCCSSCNRSLAAYGLSARLGAKPARDGAFDPAMRRQPLRQRARSLRGCWETHWRRLCRALRPDASAEAPQSTIAALARGMEDRHPASSRLVEGRKMLTLTTCGSKWTPSTLNPIRGAPVMRSWPLLLTLLVALAGCQPESTPVEIRPVRTIVVDPRPLSDDRRAVGEVKPRYRAICRSA